MGALTLWGFMKSPWFAQSSDTSALRLACMLNTWFAASPVIVPWILIGARACGWVSVSVPATPFSSNPTKLTMADSPPKKPNMSNLWSQVFKFCLWWGYLLPILVAICEERDENSKLITELKDMSKRTLIKYKIQLSTLWSVLRHKWIIE